MSKRIATAPSPAAVHAASMLRAWITSDEPAFRRALGKTLALCSLQATTADEEQVELLKGVAASLREVPFGSVSGSLVHLCIDLLAHVSGQLRLDPSNSVARCDLTD